MKWGFVFAVGLCLAFYLLYINGLLLLSVKTAVVFTGYVRRNGEAALQFAACNGQVKRVLRFHKAGNYEFAYPVQKCDGKMQRYVELKKKIEYMEYIMIE